MRTSDHWHEGRETWHHVGRATERFARRVARDAQQFAKRVEEHVGEFAHEFRREWRCGKESSGPGPDVRGVFDDVRGIMSAILDGIDELMTDLSSGATERGWSRVVSNRDATCGGCTKALAAGAEVLVRRRAGGLEFRCLDCGVPADQPPPA